VGAQNKSSIHWLLQVSDVCLLLFLIIIGFRAFSSFCPISTLQVILLSTVLWLIFYSMMEILRPTHLTPSTRFQCYRLLSCLEWQHNTLLQNSESRNHLSLQRASVESRCHINGIVISHQAPTSESNTSKTLSVLASTDSCGASCFLAAFVSGHDSSFRLKNSQGSMKMWDHAN
jgi:hypothetical protein